MHSRQLWYDLPYLFFKWMIKSFPVLGHRPPIGERPREEGFTLIECVPVVFFSPLPASYSPFSAGRIGWNDETASSLRHSYELVDSSAFALPVDRGSDSRACCSSAPFRCWPAAILLLQESKSSEPCSPHTHTYTDTHARANMHTNSFRNTQACTAKIVLLLSVLQWVIIY